jgi:hypothetical protein
VRTGYKGDTPRQATQRKENTMYEPVMEDINWRDCPESSNVRRVGWPRSGETVMFVEYKNGHIYAYTGVSRQRAVATWLSHSTGQFMNKRIKPRFPSIQVTL